MSILFYRLANTFLFSVCLALATWSSAAETGKAAIANPIVNLETTSGTITLELYPEHAPITVANFLQYVDDGFYDGLIFHRVISHFMIQGGGFSPDLKEKTTRPTIKNESNNQLSNAVGTIAMARLNAPDSAASQFFINLVNNFNLNAGLGRPGYTVFGKVIAGMDVVEKIGQVKTYNTRRLRNIPVEPVIIIVAERQSPSPQPTQ